ncbi:MAG: cob(I)yrinic acid a,c-diamide adenosyltransferase [Treponema sp.]|jgi:cob(I)alamin adenosyltransferase|nr:cob(I)yrinic acid a,c-diamide adenosyltransferase [Treponema sp.]
MNTISKDDELSHFTGTVDELNSNLGLVKALLTDKDTCQFIEDIQKKLMKLMSHVSDPQNKNYFFSNDDTAILTNKIKKLKEKLPEQTQFVIPGRNPIEAQIHITRTVTRRAERLYITASNRQPLCEQAGEYLNKLSDYLFFLALMT